MVGHSQQSDDVEARLDELDAERLHCLTLCGTRRNHAHQATALLRWVLPEWIVDGLEETLVVGFGTYRAFDQMIAAQRRMYELRTGKPWPR